MAGLVSMAGNKYKGSKYTEGFTGIVHSVFESPAFAALSPNACKLPLELAGAVPGQQQRQFDGDLVSVQQAGLAVKNHDVALQG